MDDILLAGPDANILEKYLMELKVYTTTTYLKKKKACFQRLMTGHQTKNPIGLPNLHTVAIAKPGFQDWKSLEV